MAVTPAPDGMPAGNNKGPNVPKWCQNHEGARRAKPQIWREYKANGRTLRDSNPRHLVPKKRGRLDWPALLDTRPHYLPCISAKYRAAPSEWCGPIRLFWRGVFTSIL